MRAGERELGFVVIEGDVLPGCGSVTRSAVGAKLTLMRVVLYMTGAAIRRGPFEDIVHVTLRAGHVGVGAGELEGCLVVVELRGRPSGTRMAGGAILPKLTRVRIVLLVAGEAVFRRSCEVRQCKGMVVALVAGNVRVPSSQREGKTRMAESPGKAVHAIVTGKTIRAIGNQVGLRERQIDLTMATHAGLLIECLDVERMTILAGEGRAVDVFSMAPERISQGFVRKLPTRHIN